MIVVADTSPINYLCQLGHVDILPAIFGSVNIPQAVVAELSVSAAPLSVRQFISHVPNWLEIGLPSDADSSLEEFGLGEQQAIALARELQADLLIADDMEARLAAEHQRISVIGTLGVLRIAAAQNLLQLAPAITGLQALGFYMSDKLVREMLGES